MSMQEELTIGPAAQLDLRVYLSALRRRFLYLLVPAALVFAAACAVAYLVLPVAYQANAKVLVESQQVPTDLATSVVKASAAERIQLIQQRLMAADNLVEIAHKFDLYPNERGRLAPSELVDRIRSATEIAQIDPGESEQLARRSDMQSVGFTVSFKYYDPDVASKVANAFVDSILEQNVRSRERRAAETSKFFEKQAAQLEQGLADLDARIADFKKANAAAMPDTLAARRTQLEQLETAMGDIDRRITLGADQQQIVASKAKIALLNSQLESSKQQLQAVNDQRRDLLPLLEKGYITKNRILELDKNVASLEGEIRQATAEIDIETSKLQDGEAQVERLPAARADLAERVAALQKTMISTPEVEAAYNSLTRDHDNMQAEYNAVKGKMAAAATGEQLEENRQSERFEVVEHATVPIKPVSPDRQRIILGGAFGSIAAGIGMVVLMEMLDKSIRSSADLERQLQIRPLVAIPYVTTLAERNRKGRMLRVILVYGSFLALLLIVLYNFSVVLQWLQWAV